MHHTDFMEKKVFFGAINIILYKDSKTCRLVSVYLQSMRVGVASFMAQLTVMVTLSWSADLLTLFLGRLSLLTIQPVLVHKLLSVTDNCPS